MNSKGKAGAGSSSFHRSTTSGSPNRGSGAYQIQFMDPKAQAEIERVQPYHRGSAYDEDPLWWLHELSRFDKHRLLNIVGIAIESIGMENFEFENLDHGDGLTNPPEPLMTFMHMGPLKGRTQLAQWAMKLVAADPTKGVTVTFRPNLDVAFAPATPVVGRRGVLSVLTAIDDHLVCNVLPPLVAFLQ